MGYVPPMASIWVGQCEKCGRTTSVGQRVGDAIYCDRCVGQSNRQTIENYLRARQVILEVELEQLFARIDSLGHVVDIMDRGAYWHEAFDVHLKQFVHPEPEQDRYTPLHERRLAPPRGSGPRIQQYPTRSYACCNVTDIERR